MTPKILNSVMQSVEKAMDMPPQQTPEPVLNEIERILDEESAWIARPSPEVTRRIALRATLAAQCVMTELALFDARETMIEGAIMPERLDEVLETLKDLSESSIFTQEARDLFKTAHGLIERTVIIDYETAIAAQISDASATDDLVDRFATALKEKLRAAEQKYGFSNDWLKDDWQGELIAKLLNHVQKGDPRDVAAYCAFAWHHGWSVTPKRDYGSMMPWLRAPEA